MTEADRSLYNGAVKRLRKSHTFIEVPASVASIDNGDGSFTVLARHADDCPACAVLDLIDNHIDGGFFGIPEPEATPDPVLSNLCSDAAIPSLGAESLAGVDSGLDTNTERQLAHGWLATMGDDAAPLSTKRKRASTLLLWLDEQEHAIRELHSLLAVTDAERLDAQKKCDETLAAVSSPVQATDRERLDAIAHDLSGATEDAMVLREEAAYNDGLAAGVVTTLARVQSDLLALAAVSVPPEAADRELERLRAIEKAARTWRSSSGGFNTQQAASDLWDVLDVPDASLVAPPEGCQCEACSEGVKHASDCSVHNMPAYPNGPCDCDAVPQPVETDEQGDGKVGEAATASDVKAVEAAVALLVSKGVTGAVFERLLAEVSAFMQELDALALLPLRRDSEGVTGEDGDHHG